MSRNSCGWFFFGLATGASVGLLYSPMAGARQRRMIARKARQVHSTLADTVKHGRDAMERAHDVMERTLDTVRNTVGA